jgi:hypothetical protein
LLLALQFSVRLSRLTHRHRTMAQRLTLLEQEVERLRHGGPPSVDLRPLRSPPPLTGAPQRQQDGTG